MNYSNDHYFFFLYKINDFIWKPFDKMLPCSFVFYWMNFRISSDEVDSCINLQKKVIT